MGWAIGYDGSWKRDIGYGVPAVCDQPGCSVEIDRGLGHVCGGDAYGGEHGCGLFFCSEHLRLHTFRDGCTEEVCTRCDHYRQPYEAKPDTPEWIRWKLEHESWQQWREENPAEVAHLRTASQANSGGNVMTTGPNDC